MAVPATVIYFTTYDQLRDYLCARTGSRGHHIPLLAGALARREYPSSPGVPLRPPCVLAGERSGSLSCWCLRSAPGSPGALMAPGRLPERTGLMPTVPPPLQWVL